MTLLLKDINDSTLKKYTKKYHYHIIEENDEINLLYKSLVNTNTTYEYVLENFIKAVSTSNCFIESASLATVNENLLWIQALMYKNIKNILGQAYNKNYTVKKGRNFKNVIRY